MGLKLKDSEVIPFQPEFARNIPLDENEERNGEKAASLIMMIGISGGGKMQSWFLQIYKSTKKIQIYFYCQVLDGSCQDSSPTFRL